MAPSSSSATTQTSTEPEAEPEPLSPSSSNEGGNDHQRDHADPLGLSTDGEPLYDDVDLERDEVVEIEKDSAQQTSRVNFWRLVVALGLIITGVAVTAGSYQALLNQETTNFENAYAQFSRTVGQAAVEEILRLREAARSFAKTMESTAQLTNTTWPFYDYYDGLGTFAQEQVDAKHMESIGYVTRVSHEQRQAYLDFQRQHYERWVKDGHMRAYGNLDVLFQDLYHDDILEINDEFAIVPSSDKDEYYPLAYRYPPPNSYFIINFDIRSINYDQMFASLHQLKNQTLLSNINPYVDADEAEAAYHEQFHDQLPNADSQTSFPHSFLFHPVHDLSPAADPDDDIVAVITYPLAWDASLRRLLPDQVEGIVAVARNNCGQAVTYEIVGPDAYFLGWEDMHDARYDDHEYVVNLDFNDHPQFYDTPGHCAYSLSIYPSQRFEQAYHSQTPVVYVGLVGCTFAVMILFFFAYDGVVQHRNRKLVRDAARSNELVTSMFPGALRDKIMDQKMAKGSSNMTWNKKSKELALLLQQHHDQAKLLQELTIDDAEPLAELHPETTISFSDIVGFTKWSTSREPSEVFKLLETIYRAFDILARQRKIFKVETVGDCYVAVAGFPDKQDDHAARMCRFAVQCMKNFSRVVSALEDTLGADTTTLNLRVGIHSGPVTAGVLRGDRTRFQLFGDAMNTTARVETTGEGGRIHISQSTAELLVADGFEKWIVRREDPVHAKGLGYIQTYFLKVNSDGQRRRSTMSTVATMTATPRTSSNILAQYVPADDSSLQDETHEATPIEQAPAEKLSPSKGQRLSQFLDMGQKMLRLEEEVQATGWDDEMSI